MAIYYSAARHGFFDDAIHSQVPEDAVRIAPARHRELLEAQASGATIEAGENGKPRINRPRNGLTEERLRTIRLIKKEAARRITMCAPIWQQLNDLRSPSDQATARFAAIDAIRAASDLIEAQVADLDAAQIAALDIPAHTAWPE